MEKASQFWEIFNESISDYHIGNEIDTPMPEKYPADSFEFLLYRKNWVDTVQWHLEDIIRDENINPESALKLKRRIDASNQVRTDIVEYIDDYFLQKFAAVVPKENARLNTETPAWALDRLSILALKVYHMREETLRTDADAEHISKCTTKLNTLLEQQKDLTEAIDTLLQDISQGNVKVKIYRQMKMYNDESLNPVLYKNRK